MRRAKVNETFPKSWVSIRDSGNYDLYKPWVSSLVLIILPFFVKKILRYDSISTRLILRMKVANSSCLWRASIPGTDLFTGFYLGGSTGE